MSLIEYALLRTTQKLLVRSRSNLKHRQHYLSNEKKNIKIDSHRKKL